jgi:very-short-patch-repair endonuclease
MTFIKGHIPWNKGLHPKGHPMSEETKRKIGLANKGKKQTKEQKRILIEANRGRIPWNKGKTGIYSKEALKKMSEGKKKNPSRYWLGKKRSEETKMKISKTKEGVPQPWNSHPLSKEQIKKILTRRLPTSLETKFQGIIDKYNLPYKYVGNGKFFIERYNPDFINTNNEKIAIEVYARYYKRRNHEDIEEWRNKRQEVFNKYGWKIIYFNEVEVNEKYILNLLEVV